MTTSACQVRVSTVEPASISCAASSAYVMTVAEDSNAREASFTYPVYPTSTMPISKESCILHLLEPNANHVKVVYSM